MARDKGKNHIPSQCNAHIQLEDCEGNRLSRPACTVRGQWAALCNPMVGSKRPPSMSFYSSADGLPRPLHSHEDHILDLPLISGPGAQLDKAQGASCDHRPSNYVNILVSLLTMTHDPLGASKDWREGERLAKQANNVLFVTCTSESLVGSLCRTSSNSAFFFGGYKRTVRWLGPMQGPH